MRLLTFTLIALLSTHANAAEQFADVKRSMREEAVDGDSLKFRKLFTKTKPEGTAVCGEMNGKNQLGGYSGWHRFIWISGTAVVLDNHNTDSPGMNAIFDENTQRTWDKFCGD